MKRLAFRKRARRAIFVAALAACFLPPPGGAAAASTAPLVLVDDRGEPVAGFLEVCFVEGLGTDCVDRAPEAGPLELPAFDIVRIEGPDHGPVSVRRRDLPAVEDGVRRLTVPRKATLRVRGAGDRRLTAALRPLATLDAGRPAHGLIVPGDGELKVPAGEWLLALEERGAAPDLHLLLADPGSAHTVRYRPRAGWSLVVRAVSKADGEPVAGARLEVREAKQVGPRSPEGEEADPEPPPRTAETGPAGFAFVSGIEDAVVDLKVRHPDFVETTLPGVSSNPGALEHREAALGRGATLQARVRVDGEAAAGWRCALLDRSGRNVRGRSRQVGSMEAGKDGVCRGERLPEGLFWLHVTSPPDASVAAAEREVRFYDGEETAIDLDLSPIRVEGEARRGEEPVAGLAVRIFRLSETGSTSLVEPVAEAVTGEDGAYETTVWDAGFHAFHLANPGGHGPPIDTEHTDVQPPETRVDFRLAPGDVEGVVVDEDGEVVPGASVRVDWEVAGGRFKSSLRAEEDGTFRLPREAEAGTLELTAEHPGFRPDTVRLELVEDAVPPPIVLTLRRGGLLRGRVVTAAGAPATRVVVQSFEARARAAMERKGSSRTDAEGAFEVVPADGSATRLFVTGPECPLTVANVADPSEPVLLTCPQVPGTLQVRFVDGEERPVVGELVLLRSEDGVIPVPVLLSHLSYLGQALKSDGSGRLVIPGLAPGTYDVYRSSRASEAMVAQGRPEGLLGSVAVAPGQTAELEALVASRR